MENVLLSEIRLYLTRCSLLLVVGCIYAGDQSIPRPTLLHQDCAEGLTHVALEMAKFALFCLVCARGQYEDRSVEAGVYTYLANQLLEI